MYNIAGRNVGATAVPNTSDILPVPDSNTNLVAGDTWLWGVIFTNLSDAERIMLIQNEEGLVLVSSTLAAGETSAPIEFKYPPKFVGGLYWSASGEDVNAYITVTQ